MFTDLKSKCLKGGVKFCSKKSKLKFNINLQTNAINITSFWFLTWYTIYYSNYSCACMSPVYN